MTGGQQPDLPRLRARSPLEWAMRIAALPAHLRVPAASIVWWDYFGRRLAAERWPELDHFIAAPYPAQEDEDEIEDALVQLGYPRAYARKRLHRSDVTERKRYEARVCRKGGVTAVNFATA